MKYVQPARRELKIRTVFNLLGPLTNPAGASAQVVGVYSAALVDRMAEALKLLGLRRAMVVHGYDGLDEITISAPTRIAELRDGVIQSYEIRPEQFGFPLSPLESLAGGDAQQNAGIHSRHSFRGAFAAPRYRAAERRGGAHGCRESARNRRGPAHCSRSPGLGPGSA